MAEKKILLVEDNEVNRRLAGFLLRSQDYQVREAPSAKDAFEILKTEQVDLIVMDIQLPGMDGLEATAKLKELLHYRGFINDDRDELIESLTAFAEKSSLDIVDCILCAKAKKSNMSLFTFDEALMSHSKRSSS